MSEQQQLTDEVRFELDEVQAAVADCLLRGLGDVICLMGARGGGKSSCLIALILMVALLKPKSQILYFSQSTSNSEDQFKKLIQNEVVQQYLLQSPDQDPYTTKPHPTIRFANGSEVLFFSLEDWKGKLGYHPSGAIFVDEAQSVSELAWSVSIFPMRGKVGKPTPVIVAGTVTDTDGHWWWRLHDNGTRPNNLGIRSFSLTTDTSLAFKGPGGEKLLAQARAIMPERDFLSQFKLIPGGSGDKYFNHADIDACVAAFNPEDVDERNGTIMALDPSLSTQDPQAYLCMDLKGNVFKSHSIDMKLTDTQQVQEIVDQAKAHKSLLCVESNATPSLIYVGTLKMLIPHGIREVPFRDVSTKSQEAKNILFKQLAWYMEHRKIRISPECKELIKQLKNITEYKTPSGALTLKCPGREHDDEAACLVVACEALHKGWRPTLQRGNPAMGLL